MVVRVLIWAKTVGESNGGGYPPILWLKRNRWRSEERGGNCGGWDGVHGREGHVQQGEKTTPYPLTVWFGVWLEGGLFFSCPFCRGDLLSLFATKVHMLGGLKKHVVLLCSGSAESHICLSPIMGKVGLDSWTPTTLIHSYVYTRPNSNSNPFDASVLYSTLPQFVFYLIYKYKRRKKLGTQVHAVLWFVTLTLIGFCGLLWLW